MKNKMVSGIVVNEMHLMYVTCLWYKKRVKTFRFEEEYQSHLHIMGKGKRERLHGFGWTNNCRPPTMTNKSNHSKPLISKQIFKLFQSVWILHTLVYRIFDWKSDSFSLHHSLDSIDIQQSLFVNSWTTMLLFCELNRIESNQIK